MFLFFFMRDALLFFNPMNYVTLPYITFSGNNTLSSFQNGANDR